MRIISGKYGGRILSPPRNFRARPTTDLARESLFNILSNQWDFQGLNVLDLFAGTGSIGFEFASRGAGKVKMVEVNYGHYKYIRKVIDILGTDNVDVVRVDFFRIIHSLDEKYDIIFADPPYRMKNLPEVPETILSAEILHPGGWLILEHSSGYDFTGLDQFTETRTYGSVNFSFFIHSS